MYFMPSLASAPLFIPELIQEIMHLVHEPDFNSKKPISYDSINAAGLVCTAWREVSLNAKWRDAYFRHLLRVLGPYYFDAHGRGIVSLIPISKCGLT